MMHVIIGVGAAGITAAKTIRSQQPDASITMISTDEHVHSRCMLHRYLSHERQEDTLSFVEPDFFETNKIEWIKGVSVKTVDVKNQQVLLDNDTSCHYDKLLSQPVQTASSRLLDSSVRQTMYSDCGIFRMLRRSARWPIRQNRF